MHHVPHKHTHTHAHNIHTLCNDITANCTIGGCYTYTEFRGLFSYRDGREEFKRNLGKRTQLSIERYSPLGARIFPGSCDRVNKGDVSADHALFGIVHGINGLYHSYSVHTVPIIFSIVLTHS